MARTGAMLDAALLGAAAGLRSFMPPAVLAARGQLGGRRTSKIIMLTAAGELVGDKLSVTPPRTDPLPLAGRIGSGAVCGRHAAGTTGATVGAVSAGLATLAAYRGRTALGERTGLPDPVLGLAEDVLALALSVAATRRA
jgi:uncharacterized membrane protein